MSKLKKMPEFKTEAEEREFWETHDSTDYLDWSQAKPASFPKLKPSNPLPRRSHSGCRKPCLIGSKSKPTNGICPINR